MVLALTTVTAVLGDSLPRGLASLFFGLALGLVGIDLQTGQARFTLGVPELLDGIDTVVVAVGLFAIGETLYVAARYRYETEEIYQLKGSMWMSRAGLGALLEALAARHRSRLPDRRPAGRRQRDPDLPLLPVEKRLAKHPEEFGKGAIEAVAGPEAANNAAVAGTLAPAAVAGPADLGHRRHHAGRLPAIRPAARPAPLRQQPRAGLGPDGQPLYRQRAAAALEPAAGRGLGEAPGASRGPGSMPASWSSPRSAAYTLNNNVADLIDPVDHRPDRLRHARAGRAGGPLRRRPDPGAAGRAAVPPCPGDQRGRRLGLLHPSDLAGAARHRRRPRAAADLHAPPPANAREPARQHPRRVPSDLPAST